MSLLISHWRGWTKDGGKLTSETDLKSLEIRADVAFVTMQENQDHELGTTMISKTRINGYSGCLHFPNELNERPSLIRVDVNAYNPTYVDNVEEGSPTVKTGMPQGYRSVEVDNPLPI